VQRGYFVETNYLLQFLAKTKYLDQDTLWLRDQLYQNVEHIYTGWNRYGSVLTLDVLTLLSMAQKKPFFTNAQSDNIAFWMKSVVESLYNIRIN